jgi:hypothetical protein
LEEVVVVAAVRLFEEDVDGVVPARCFFIGCLRRGDMKFTSGLFILTTMIPIT